MPVYTGFVTVAFFAAIGLPSMSGFISEALVFIGAFGVDTLKNSYNDFNTRHSSRCGLYVMDFSKNFLWSLMKNGHH